MSLGNAAALSDPGRKRRQNEDSYVCEPPLFAVADGMGGAQAGEIASHLAAAAVSRGEPIGESGEERVVGLIQEANRSVFERASADETVSGMGTTMTVALVDNGIVWIGHVGDSRAYLVRDGRLEQLTEDHSLVAELVRSGKLTPEEAGAHPHRSVITRALGTEPEVEVDAFSVEPRPGDVFMLCSDGLTSMVDDAGILDTVRAHRGDLAGLVRALVRQANDAGGEDNITVVVFEFDGVGDTIELALSALEPPVREDEETLSELDGMPTLEAVPLEPTAPAATGRWRRWRVVAPLALAVLVVLVGLAVYGFSRSHFVGAAGDGHVAVYQGVPWNLPFGIHLYRLVYESPLLAVQLSPQERRRLFDHDLHSKSTAIAEIERYERNVVP